MESDCGIVDVSEGESGLTITSCPERSPTPPEEPFSVTLSPQIFIELFQQLDPVTSACVGVTCKANYKLHKSHYPVPIRLRKFVFKKRESFQLYQLLTNWVGRDLIYHDQGLGVFITTKKMERLERDKEKKIKEFWTSIDPKIAHIPQWPELDDDEDVKVIESKDCMGKDVRLIDHKEFKGNARRKKSKRYGSMDTTIEAWRKRMSGEHFWF